MSPQIVATALNSLRNAGSVFGLMLAKGHEILYHDAPYPEEFLSDLATTVDDISYYFEQNHRQADQLAIGYDGCNILLVMHGPYHLLVFHHHAEEIDFISKAAASFLKDYEMGLLADEWAPVSEFPVPAQDSHRITRATQRVPVTPSKVQGR